MFEITEEMRLSAWEAIGQVVCEGPYSIEAAEYEDKPFLIVGSWEALSALNDAINAAVCPEAWAEWRPVYEERGGSTPFSGLRIGREGAGGKEIAPYLIPDDLLALEELAEVGFSDEYVLCGECNGVIHTQPEYYGWKPDFWHAGEHGYLCGDCVREHYAEEYLDERVAIALVGGAVGCYLLNPQDYGFVQVAKGLENGMHSGQADDPKKIARWGADNDLEVVFVVHPGQFDAAFDVWVRSQFVHPVDVEQARMALLGYSEEPRYSDTLLAEFLQVPDMATMMKAALRQR